MFPVTPELVLSVRNCISPNVNVVFAGVLASRVVFVDTTCGYNAVKTTSLAVFIPNTFAGVFETVAELEFN